MTTPQQAAAEVAVRAGMIAKQTNQRIAGVIENMSGFPCPHCGERSTSSAPAAARRSRTC